MLTLRQRRRLGSTISGLSAYQQNMRAANEEHINEDDALRAARGIINALVISGAVWALLAVGAWAIWLLGE